MNEYQTGEDRSIGPIPALVREHWLGDLPYPTVSAAQRNAQRGQDASNRRAERELLENLPDFAVSSTYERVYIGRNGEVYRLHTRDEPDAVFSDQAHAAAFVRESGYSRLPEHDTNVKLAYDRGPRGPRT